MLTIKNMQAMNFENAMRGARNPLNSWAKMDSGYDENGNFAEQLKNASGENMNKTMDGVYPLIAGVTDENQTQKILAHLKSEEEMMSKVGVSAVNMKASYYADNGYWNGNVWFSHQWFLWKTMLDLGEADFAFKIAKTALDAWKKEVDYSNYTFEMISIKTGRGGWFHNFGGLSAPVNLWASAYFEEGSLTAGFDCFIENQQFNENNTGLELSLLHRTGKNGIVIASMRENGNYTVTLNGKNAEFKERLNGTLEIVIPADTEKAEISVQLV